MYAAALIDQARSGAPFDQALARAFRAEACTLDDRTAGYALHRDLGTSPQALRANLAAAVQERRGTEMSVAQAADLVRRLLGAEVFGRMAPLVPHLLRERTSPAS